MTDRAGALLAAVNRHRDEQCQAIDAEASVQVRDIIDRAHHDAKNKVHAVIVDERRNAKRAIEKQRAKIETASRQNLQERERVFLDGAWVQLIAALKARWQDDQARADWLAGMVDQAINHLHPGPWSIEHPPAWSPSELDPLLEQITTFSGSAPQFASASDLSVGLRISANGATVDGSLQGVIADGEEISALLLADLFDDAELPS